MAKSVKNKLSFVPSAAIEGKFRVVNTHLPVLHSKIGKVDFRVITLEQAEQLVEAGTDYLVKVKK